MISVYDLGPSTHPETQASGASPFVRIVIYILRYKKIPHEIITIGWSDIQRIAPELGAPPTILTPTPKYTIPFIKDSTTGKVVSDSAAIAEYLDEAYPDTPTVVPANSIVLHKIFMSDYATRLQELFRVVLRPKIIPHFPKEYRDLNQSLMLSPATPEAVEGAFGKVKEELEKLHQILSGGAPYRKFIMGDKPTFADFALVAFTYPLKFLNGEDSDEWKQLQSMAGGWIGWEIDQLSKTIAL
ncbi:hypothetical protein V5O48_008767 [Marasmius crinis-equi]|uniref:GST N-terminal domain-containing protein n=1 Tax=Marasmius crinis-equi TaxID=585013 RepID=A0ABR3FD14_9AGAR